MIKIVIHYTKWHEAFQWCIEHCGPFRTNSNWNFFSGIITGNNVWFYFKDSNDAMRFRLVWG